jgi:hypothetical protein
MVVMMISSICASAQAEQRQDEHDHDDQAHEIDDAMHRRLLKTGVAGSLRDVARPAWREPVAKEKVPVSRPGGTSRPVPRWLAEAMSIHPQIFAPPPPKPKTARASHLYGAIPAVAVMLAIGMLAFGSMLHRAPQPVEPVTAGQGRSLAIIAPITDPMADTE